MSSPSTRPQARLVQEDGKVWIAGMEKLTWQGEQENSVMRCLAIAMQTVGRSEYTYEYLMGISAQAFRIQLFKDGWCPSSPHARMGFNTGEVAVESLPYKLVRYEFIDEDRKNDPNARQEAYRAVAASIDRGVPALFGSEEQGLVVGYSEDGGTLLGRSYMDRKKPGFKSIDKLPWGFGVLVERGATPDRRERIIHSLKLAVKLANTESFEQYYSGWKAYEAWIAQLKDANAFVELSAEDLKGRQFGNAYIYYCLVDARTRAAGYLKSVQAQFTGEPPAHLAKAAELYGQITQRLSNPCPTEIAPMPGMMKEAQRWTQDMRNRQAKILEECRSLEKQAISEIEKALALMD